MAANDEVLLNQLLNEQKEARNVAGVPALADDRAFEIFACDQALRDFDLTEAEVIDGVVGGGRDGGFDGIFTFMNDVLLTEDSEIFEQDFSPSKLPRGAKLELVLLQAKQQSSFGESALEKAKISIEQLLDLRATEEVLEPLFNAGVIERIMIFRNALLTLLSKSPNVSIRFVYASKGDISTINTRVKAKAELVKREMEKAYSKANADVQFLGAAELWRTATSLASYSLDLSFDEQLGLDGSHIVLTTLAEYRRFISNDDGTLRRHIFDWNVRDWQGGVEVNDEIIASLMAASSPEIWWMNNGVTVICSSASSVGDKFRLEDVQVVNGLQTSVSIFEAFKNVDPDDPRLQRHLVVRLLATEDLEYRDKVIRATNRQTKVPDASLRATDPLQRQIEVFLLSGGLYYDRRRNYYKNIGKPSTNIVSIIYLAQAMLAVCFAEPNGARARPGAVMKNDLAYRRVFDPDIELIIFQAALQIQRAVDAYLDVHAVDPQERTNLRFYLATMAVSKLVGGVVRAPSQLLKVAQAGSLPSEAQIEESLKELRAIIKDERTKNELLSFDQLVKGSIVVERVMKAMTP